MKERSRSRLNAKSEGRRLPSYFDLIDDELRRRGAGGGGGKRASAVKDKGTPAKHPAVSSALSRAAGNNAVVVKVLSYGAGAGSVRHVLHYQAKEEKAHDQDDREVSDINEAVRLWERELGHRKGSRDVLRLTYELENANRGDTARAISSLAEDGFRRVGDIDRTYAFSVSNGEKGQTRLHFVLVIAHERRIGRIAAAATVYRARQTSRMLSSSAWRKPCGERASRRCRAIRSSFRLVRRV